MNLSTMASKRVYRVEGDTPGKPKEKNTKNSAEPKTSRKSLFDVKKLKSLNKATNIPWTTEETSALVQYICLYWDEAHTNSWPKMKNENFWQSCSDAVNKSCQSSRTGT